MVHDIAKYLDFDIISITIWFVCQEMRITMQNRLITTSIAGFLGISACITPVFASESQSTNVTDEIMNILKNYL